VEFIRRARLIGGSGKKIRSDLLSASSLNPHGYRDKEFLYNAQYHIE
jgi:hypothetical protein